MPLSVGTEIDYRGQRAIVVDDKGGPTLVVDCEGSTQEWLWNFEGYECSVVDKAGAVYGVGPAVGMAVDMLKRREFKS